MLPEIIRESVLWGPVSAAIVFALFLAAAGITNLIIRVIVGRWQRRAPNTPVVEILAAVRGSVVLFIALSGFFLGLLVLTSLTSERYALIEGWADWISKAWLVVAIGEVAYIIYKASDALLNWYMLSVAATTETELDDRLLPPIKRVLPLLVYSLGALTALAALNIPITPILAGLGVGGLAVALAVQPTLANFFAGTYVVTEGELNEGDYIELQGGPAGYVVEVGWRSTKIRTMFNNLVIIPNSRMVDSIVTNYYSPTPAINVLVYCGVSYDADLVKVEEVVRSAARELVNSSPHAVKDDEPWVGFDEFADSNINFWVFVQATDRIGSFALTSDLVKAIHSRLTAAGIEINYPVRKILYPDGAGAAPPMPPTPPAPPA